MFLKKFTFATVTIFPRMVANTGNTETSKTKHARLQAVLHQAKEETGENT